MKTGAKNGSKKYHLFFVGLLSYKQKRGLKATHQLWEENGFSNPLSPGKKYISLEAFTGLIFGVHLHKVCLN